MIFALISIALVAQSPEPLSIEVPAGKVYELELNEPGSDESDLLELDEISLGEGSKLKLPYFESVRINNLIAKDGGRIEIAHNSSGADGDQGVHGSDGANATFFIDRIDGHVILEARGGHGGDGRNGRHGRQGLPGAKGRDGFKLFWFIYLENGRDGKTGGPGEDGEDGQDGGNGGDGGTVKVYYQEKSEFSNILVDVSAGKAGKGGLPGQGGLGGPGGPGGKGIKRGKQGLMGRTGKNGRPGRPGVPGNPGSVSIYQVEKALYFCLIEYELIKDETTEEDWRECLQL